MSEDFVRGLTLSLAVAVPIGPVALLCIQRTLAEGVRSGLATGLGTATAHALYAAAGTGALALGFADPRTAAWLGGCGGVVLLCLGWRTLSRTVHEVGGAVAASGPATCYGAAVLVALGNPLTWTYFAALIPVVVGVGEGGGGPAPRDLPALALGAFVGSASWWAVLVAVTSGFRARLRPGWLTACNRASGLIMLFLGGLFMTRTL